MKIRSKSMYAYVLIDDKLISPKNKNYNESCLYDTNGNVIEDYYSYFDGKMYTVNYLYNEKGLLSQSSRSIMGEKPTYFTYYFYDKNNNLIKESAASQDNILKDITTYEYNANDRLVKKISHGEYMITYQYEYDAYGSLVNTIETSGLLRHANHYSRTLVYNIDSMVTECRNYSDMILGSTFSYKYDGKGNLFEEKIHWEDSGKDRKSLYEYNENGYVVSSVTFDGAEKIYNSRFKYDPNGLLIEKVNLDSKDNVASIYKYVYEYYK